VSLTPVRPEFVPDASSSRAEMESLQRAVRRAARFEDDHGFDLHVDDCPDTGDELQTPLVDGAEAAATQLSLPARVDPGGPDLGDAVVAGVDQAFLEDRAVSAIVCLDGGTGAVVARAHSVTDLEIPYVPGLLAFREGGPILAAFAQLDVEPDLVVFDGSGRIHYRQAGIATHVGVTLDLPSVGVAKNLLCGRLAADPDGRPAGWHAPVHADDQVEVDADVPVGNGDSDPATRDGEGSGSRPDPVIGAAYQSRQYDSRPVINPLYVSAGHRLSTRTTVAAVAACCDGYKLPEPTRRADAYADELKADLT
jgi:deoxyribonuclease V